MLKGIGSPTTPAKQTMLTQANTRLPCPIETINRSIEPTPTIASPKPVKLSIDYTSLFKQPQSSPPSTISADGFSAEGISAITTVQPTVPHAFLSLIPFPAIATALIATPLSLPTSAVILRPVATSLSQPLLDTLMTFTAKATSQTALSTSSVAPTDSMSSFITLIASSTSSTVSMAPATPVTSSTIEAAQATATSGVSALGNAQLQGPPETSEAQTTTNHTTLIAILGSFLGLAAVSLIIAACFWRRSVFRKRWSPRRYPKQLNTTSGGSTLCPSPPKAFTNFQRTIDFEKPGMGLPPLYRPGKYANTREPHCEFETSALAELPAETSKQTGMLASYLQ